MKPNKKIVIKGGLGVLEKLLSIGGINSSGYTCENSNLYYWISSYNNIEHSLSIPIGYTIINVDVPISEEELTFPRVMYVSNSPITKNNPGIKKVVCAYLPKYESPYIAYDIDNMEELETRSESAIQFWNYVKEINEPSTLKLTMNQIAEKFNVDSVEIIKE